MQKFCKFAYLKLTFFYFILLFLQNTHISLSIIHIYSNKIFISLPHSHRPTPTIHTEIHNPPVENQKNKPNKIDENPLIKIDASGGDGKNEKQDRRLRWRWREWETRSMPPKASGGDGDGKRHSTRNSLIKPIQPENNEKQRNKEQSAAMAIGRS